MDDADPLLEIFDGKYIILSALREGLPPQICLDGIEAFPVPFQL